MLGSMHTLIIKWLFAHGRSRIGDGHIWEKTLRDGSGNVFGIRRNPQTLICPVHGIERYMPVVQQLKLDLTEGSMGAKSVDTLCYFRVLKANFTPQFYDTTPSPQNNVGFPVSRTCLFPVQH